MARAAAVGRCATAASSEFVIMAGQATRGPAARHRRAGRTWRSNRGWRTATGRSTRRPMTRSRGRLIVYHNDMGGLGTWWRRSWITRGEDGDGTAPLEAVAWRVFG